MRKISYAFGLCLFAALALSPAARGGRGQERGADIYGRRDAATPTNIASLYGASHALVVGISNYEHWARLPGVKTDVDEVSRVLKERGFNVEVAEDLGSDRLLPVIKDFLARRGDDPQGRVLVYYAGHGYRHAPAGGGRGQGFIVPRDAPRPGDAMAPFLAKAVNMDELVAVTGNVRARHALYVLDSCYAGSLVEGAAFNAAGARAEPGTPARFVPAAWRGAAPGLGPEELPYISQNILAKVREPARQFIASGTYKQSVPDDSEFRRKFVAGLTDESGGGADADGDSYVTVSELGEYLKRNVTNQSAGSQRPLWGIVGSRAASEGDFVFVMPGATAREVMIGPTIDPEVWAVPEGWRHAGGAVYADAAGLMLPRRRVRHSFRDFRFSTRLKLSNNTAARFILRAQGPGDYYLVRLTGDKFPDRAEKFTLSAYVVRGGVEVARLPEVLKLSEKPVPVVERRLVRRLNHKDSVEVVIVAEGDTFTVSLLAGEGNSAGLLLMSPLKFVDKEKTFRYGVPGYLTAGGERLQLFTSHVRKLQTSEKGGN